MIDRLDAVKPGLGAKVRGQIQSRLSGAEPGSNLSLQLRVTACNLAYLELAGQHGLIASASAGMSLGEYSHLVHIGAIEAEACLDLIAARGRAYDSGPAGKMVALQPVVRSELEALTARVQSGLGGTEALVEISNVNSPSQCVIAGEAEAVETLSALAEQELAAIPKPIEDRLPMHCARFRPVAEALRPALEAAPWRPPRGVYWPNVLGVPQPEPRREVLVELLYAHVYRRVEWAKTIDGLLAAHPGALLVEVGPRRNLAAVLGRRWHPEARCLSLDQMEDASPSAFAARVQEILDAAR